MTNTNVKDIVAFIKKYAVTVSSDALPKGTSATPATKSPVYVPGGASTSGGQVNVSSSSVTQMQQAMKDFATEVTNYSTVKSGEQSDDRKMFNDFITEQYLSTSDVKGVEWSKDPTRVTKPQKQEQQSNLLEMDIVLNALDRIGRANSEFKIDGNWGFRTNNALLNVYAFANSLVQLFRDFEESANGLFSSGDLKQMYDNLIKPEDGELSKVSTSEKKKRADILAKLVKKLAGFYKAYVKTIANKPTYKRYIGGLPMFTVNTSKQDPAKKTTEDLAILQDAKSHKIGPMTLSGNKGFENISIPLDYLQSKNGFMKLLTLQPPYGLGYSINIAQTNKDIQTKVLSEIDSHVKSINQQLKTPQTDTLDNPSTVARSATHLPANK